LVCEIILAFLRTNGCESLGDRRDEGVDCSGRQLSQERFELGEELFDGIEVGTVGRQITQFGAGGFNRRTDSSDPVAGQIVHNDDIAGSQDGNDELLDVGAKARPIHWAIKYARRRNPIDAERGNKCRRLPMSPGHAGEQTLPPRTAAIAARHVGCRTGFIDEHQAFRVQVGLARTPLITSLGDIRPILLRSAL